MTSDSTLTSFQSDQSDQGTQPLTRSATSGGLSAMARPLAVPDPLYSTVHISAWAAALLTTPPFQRLAGVSLSDVPGQLLFGHPFPSRLDHAIGVYHLARLARPRDRMLQAAALAHDLGHGPFSHLTEPLMRERLGIDHEQRSVRLLDDVRTALAPSVLRRHLAWLDWDEVARLILGLGADGRGALLNGTLDYDNCDNIARFLICSGLGTLAYDPLTLARSLRPLHAEDLNGSKNGDAAHLEMPVTENEETVNSGKNDNSNSVPPSWRPTSPLSSASVGTQHATIRAMPASPTSRPRGKDSGKNANGDRLDVEHRVSLIAAGQDEARGWQRDRASVYGYLHEQHHNLALHAMLRKAVDLAAATDILPAEFFDLTDTHALDVLGRGLDRGLLALVRRVQAGAAHEHRCVWEAIVPPTATAIPEITARWRERLALEAQLAAEAGLAPHEVIVDVLVSSAARGLPPLAPLSRPLSLTWQPAPPSGPRLLHLFVAAGIGNDYIRRLRMAAERTLAPIGASYRNDGP